MNSYKIEITELLVKTIEVNADSKEEALSLIKRKYKNEDIVLDENDYFKTEFNIIEEN